RFALARPRAGAGSAGQWRGEAHRAALERRAPCGPPRADQGRRRGHRVVRRRRAQAHRHSSRRRFLRAGPPQGAARAPMTDTIAPVSTPLGRSALAVVRLSGDDAVRVADRVFRGSTGTLAVAPPRSLRHGHAVDAHGDVIDEVLAAVLPGPGSYSGETMVEIT